MGWGILPVFRFVLASGGRGFLQSQGRGGTPLGMSLDFSESVAVNASVCSGYRVSSVQLGLLGSQNQTLIRKPEEKSYAVLGTIDIGLTISL